MVLETIPAQLDQVITERVSIPTIGIGAGPHCDGQVQVFHDMLGLFTDFVPRHAKLYAQVGEVVKEAVSQYVMEVQDGAFPTERESFYVDESALSELTRPG
jgi:3-methyl-2-oxobutanoate hydroxymethyltransferase